MALRGILKTAPIRFVARSHGHVRNPDTMGGHMFDKIGESAHVVGGKTIDGDTGFWRLARQNAENRCAMVLRKERIAPRVDIKRLVIPIPEIITNKAAIAVSGDMRSQLWQQVVDARNKMRKRRTRLRALCLNAGTVDSGAPLLLLRKVGAKNRLPPCRSHPGAEAVPRRWCREA